MRQSTAVDDGHAQVVDQLFGDEKVCVPDGIEDFAYRQWNCSVTADDAKSFLQLGSHRVLEPKQVIRLQTFSQACCLDRSEPVMYVV